MRNLRTGLLVALAACGGSSNKPADAPVADSAPDAKVFLDAAIDAPPSYDLTCAGTAAPTTANAMVTLSGTLTQVDAMGLTPSFMMVSGATVDGCKANCTGGANKLATATTDANGAFSLGPIATGGTPLDAYAHVTYTTDTEVFAYPAVPVTKDVIGIPMLTFTPNVVTLLGAAGCNTTSDGAMAVQVEDCMNQTITDSSKITLSVEQNGTAVSGANVIDLGMYTSMAAGLFVVCNIPPGTTTIGATYQGTTLLAHDVSVKAAAVTETQIRPGY